jgi:hypothetical protein
MEVKNIPSLKTLELFEVVNKLQCVLNHGSIVPRKLKKIFKYVIELEFIVFCTLQILYSLLKTWKKCEKNGSNVKKEIKN